MKGFLNMVLTSFKFIYSKEKWCIYKCERENYIVDYGI